MIATPIKPIFNLLTWKEQMSKHFIGESGLDIYLACIKFIAVSLKKEF